MKVNMDVVHRREVLNGAASGGIIALAGCLSLPRNSPIATAEPGETTAVEGEPIQELAVDTFPDWVPFSGSVEVLRQPAHTKVGILRIGLENQASNAWLVTTGHPWMPFPVQVSGGLVVTSGGFEKKDGCLVKSITAEGEAGRHEFESGEQLREKRNLGTHEGSRCLPGGTHYFSDTFTAYPADDEPKNEEDYEDHGFHWGFTLVLSSSQAFKGG